MRSAAEVRQATQAREPAVSPRSPVRHLRRCDAAVPTRLAGAGKELRACTRSRRVGFSYMLSVELQNGDVGRDWQYSWRGLRCAREMGAGSWGSERAASKQTHTASRMNLFLCTAAQACASLRSCYFRAQFMVEHKTGWFPSQSTRLRCNTVSLAYLFIR